MTLRNKLEDMDIGSGDDRSFIVRQGGCDMHVSRRYLEGGWQTVLDTEVLYITSEDNPMAGKCLVFVLNND